MPPKPKNDQNISQNLKNDGNTLETKKNDRNTPRILKMTKIPLKR